MNKILVVEDNYELSGLISDLLKSEGFEVITCEDGMQGVAYTHNQKPDLIILDLMLPAGGGLHVLENIRLSNITKTIPIIVLTASKDEVHKEKAKEFGVDAYLEKPYDPELLIKTIRGLLDK